MWYMLLSIFDACLNNTDSSNHKIVWDVFLVQNLIFLKSYILTRFYSYNAGYRLLKLPIGKIMIDDSFCRLNRFLLARGRRRKTKVPCRLCSGGTLCFLVRNLFFLTLGFKWTFTLYSEIWNLLLVFCLYYANMHNLKEILKLSHVWTKWVTLKENLPILRDKKNSCLKAVVAYIKCTKLLYSCAISYNSFNAFIHYLNFIFHIVHKFNSIPKIDHWVRYYPVKNAQSAGFENCANLKLLQLLLTIT